MLNKNFGTVLNCIDGRSQTPVISWMKENFNLDYIDLITEPGIDRVLSNSPADEIKQIKDKMIISINAHHSNIVAIVGHHDCAAYPSDALKHLESIRKSILTVKSWQLPVDVIGLWVDEYWKVQPVVV